MLIAWRSLENPLWPVPMVTYFDTISVFGEQEEIHSSIINPTGISDGWEFSTFQISLVPWEEKKEFFCFLFVSFMPHKCGRE